MKKYIINVIALFFCLSGFSQNNVKSEFQRHIKYLASDELEGRLTGSNGEKLAFEYLIKEFKKSEIEAAGKNGYLQSFDFYAGMELGKNNTLKIGKTTLKVNEDYYPLSYTANKNITAKIANVGFGIEAEKLNYNNYSNAKKINGKIFLIDLSNPKPENPHSEYAEFTGVNYKIETAKRNGAAAIIFYNTNSFARNPSNKYRIKTNRYDLPIVFLTEKALAKINLNKLKKATVNVDLQMVNKKGNNVIAKIDNNAKNTIVIGAHYDHLGYGEYGGSRYTGTEKAIHNGADDNASGVAMLLELADWLKNGNATDNNYLLIAFSGEEMGLYGSKNFVKSFDFNFNNMNYMLNFDMVGRLNNEKVLNLNGTGTSPAFEVLDKINANGIEKLTKTESGVGPSDHTSFYLKDIPVLHFFTGAHADYHKPEDDEHLINYNGMSAIYDYATKLIANLNSNNKIKFSKTKDSNTNNAPKFTVTLGVMPDYAFAGKGMRIDGVTSGKTASKAGIIDGDIVVKMGNNNVYDIMSYMEALSKFKRNDKTTVKIKRAEKLLDFDVKF